MTTAYSIHVYTTEGRYACETVTAETRKQASRLFLGAITWMDTDPAANIQEVQLLDGEHAISIVYNDDPTRPYQSLLNETIQNGAKADYLAALATATERWSTATEASRDEIQSRYPDTVIFWEELDANGGKWYATYGDNAKKLAAYLEVKPRDERCHVYETGIDAALKGMKALGHNVAVCQPR